MFGIIISGSQLLIALGVFAGLITGLWKAGRWFYRWAKRIEKTIGTNGGSSIFNQFALQATSTERLSDAIAMHSTVVDLIPTPSFTIGPDGEVSSVSVPFVLATHLTLEEMKNGGFRGMLATDARDRWDDAIKNKATFVHSIVMHGRRYTLAARPKFNENRLVGWRVAMESA